MLRKLCLLATLLPLLSGCSRDDICSEGTATTPKLIITFKDVSNPLISKTVPNGLTVRTDYDDSVTIYDASELDSITLPLRTNADSARFQFVQNAGDINEIVDIYEFSYTREDVYVNRACSFKTIYSELESNEIPDNEIDWIANVLLLKTTVEDETEAHITIFH